ncbi:hypothetical protein OIU78_022466 [Salix suchowensis]|nr:hypothetical protein OIU78_022466 [Salix suchowensis]
MRTMKSQLFSLQGYRKLDIIFLAWRRILTLIILHNECHNVQADTSDDNNAGYEKDDGSSEDEGMLYLPDLEKARGT